MIYVVHTAAEARRALRLVRRGGWIVVLPGVYRFKKTKGAR